jgi:chromosome segregation ATPase
MTPQAWLAAYWLPTLILLAIGFILGWLIIGRPARKRADTAEYSAVDLQSKLRDSDRALSDSREQEQRLQNNLDATKASLAQSASQLSAAQAQVAQTSSDLTAAQAQVAQTSSDLAAAQQTVADRDSELAELKLQLTSLRMSVQQAQDSFTNVLEPLQGKAAALATENQSLQAHVEGISADLAAARAEIESLNQILTSKDTALTEAYARAVRLQRDLSEQQSQFSSTQSELVALKRNLATLTATNRDLETRLQDARGEVANELAVLTSTMLRAKDEQLAKSNAAVEGLYAQLNELRSAKPGAS